MHLLRSQQPACRRHRIECTNESGRSAASRDRLAEGIFGDTLRELRASLREFEMGERDAADRCIDRFDPS
jgi:hypothetical protein